jgi:hypothetical protein
MAAFTRRTRSTAQTYGTDWVLRLDAGVSRNATKLEVFDASGALVKSLRLNMTREKR